MKGSVPTTMTQKPSVSKLKTGRYIFYLDILGFSNLVAERGAEHVYQTVNRALGSYTRWERLNGAFRTIYFSDTFVFYQRDEGYGDWAFLDAYALASFLVSALLANGIPARGAISFGDFTVRHDDSGQHYVFFGPALIEAYRIEQRESWIGVTVSESAWSPYESENPGTIGVFEQEHTWLKRDDGVLLLNPFIKLRAWYPDDLIGEIALPYLGWDAPEFPNEIRGFRFLLHQRDDFASRGDFSGPIAVKYHSTVAFLEKVMGPDLFEWASQISEGVVTHSP